MMNLLRNRNDAFRFNVPKCWNAQVIKISGTSLIFAQRERERKSGKETAIAEVPNVIMATEATLVTIRPYFSMY